MLTFSDSAAFLHRFLPCVPVILAAFLLLGFSWAAPAFQLSHAPLESETRDITYNYKVCRVEHAPTEDSVYVWNILLCINLCPSYIWFLYWSAQYIYICKYILCVYIYIPRYKHHHFTKSLRSGNRPEPYLSRRRWSSSASRPGNAQLKASSATTRCAK